MIQRGATFYLCLPKPRVMKSGRHLMRKDMQVKNVQIEKQQTEIKAKKNQQYFLFGGLGLVIIFAGFMYNRFRIAQKQKRVIEKQKNIVEKQKHLVEEKQKDILDSIYYAERIQRALITNEKYINKELKRLKNSPS